MNVERREIIFEGEHLRIRKDYAPNAVWESVELKKYRKGAVILALTPRRELILEKHYRFPVDSYVIELPAGLAEDRENPEDCARRELLEETGYKADKLIPLFSGLLCSGLTNLEAHYFYAPNVVQTGERNLEPTEDIEILAVPFENVENFLLNLPPNTKFGVNVLAGLHMLLRYLEKERKY